MFYTITGLCPRPDNAGFCIELWPSFKKAVADSGLTQEMVNMAIKRMHRPWLDGCGFNVMIDPDEDPLARWKSDRGLEPKKLGPNAYHLYGLDAIRVQWGEWGPEHITVPGDACGLDLDRYSCARPQGGVTLLPHNVDNIRQAHLLLVVFCWFSDSISLQASQPS